jgi:hypothetical protein
MEPNEPSVIVGSNAQYGFLQRIIGRVALAPIAVVAFGRVFDDGDAWRSSISSYYYSRLGNVFVGALCALAVFFLSYQFPYRVGFGLDRVMAYVAAVAALGVALLPTPSDGPEAIGGARLVGDLHHTSAALLFSAICVLCMWCFTKSDHVDDTRPWWARAADLFWPAPPALSGGLPVRKRRRNRVFRFCGRVIFVSMVVMFVADQRGVVGHWFLIFECVAVLAFAFAWVVKGDSALVRRWFGDVDGCAPETCTRAVPVVRPLLSSLLRAHSDG